MAGSGSADPALHFLPAAVRGRLRGGAIAAPEEERFPAALAFVDISGFSKLSDELSSCHGAEGAELLQQYINSYFAPLIAAVLAHGGDVLKFAGDAFIALWHTPAAERRRSGSRRTAAPPDPPERLAAERSAASPERLAPLVHAAVRCCMSILCSLDEFEVAPGITLRLHAGIGAGMLDSFILGSQSTGFEYLVAGGVVEDMGEATALAPAGCLVISPAAAEALNEPQHLPPLPLKSQAVDGSGARRFVTPAAADLRAGSSLLSRPTLPMSQTIFSTHAVYIYIYIYITVCIFSVVKSLTPPTHSSHIVS